MSDHEFKSQVIQLLGQVLEKQNEHDNEFKMINEKLNTITEQVAANTELAHTINQLSKQTHRNTFDINSIKDRLGN